MKQYLKRTWKNKVLALGLLLVSLIPVWLDRDATILALMIVVIVPLFFADRDCVTKEWDDDDE